MHSTVNLLTLAFFQGNHNFVSKNTLNLINETNFATFWGILVFQWPCSATMLLLVILKRSRYLSKIPSIFFQQKTNFWTFRENLLIRLHSASNWLPLAVCKKVQYIFFEKPIVFFQEEATFPTLWEILLIQLHPTTFIFIFSGFWKSQFFFQKTHIFYLKKPNFKRFEKSYSFSRIVQRVCYL